MINKLHLIGLLACFVATAATGQVTAISGARVHTVGPQGTLENATVVFESGRISAVGIDIRIPADATVIDATGMIVTPGLFSPLGQLGLSEVGAVTETNDATQRGDRFSASFDVADAYNPRSMVVAVSRSDGITRAAITPVAAAADPEGNTSRVISGLGSVVHLGDSDEYFVKRGAVVVANLGEAGSTLAAGSRAAAAMVLRSALNDALDYRDNKDAVARGQWREYSVSIADLEALQSVLNREIPLLIHANRASDISVVLSIAAEYNIRAVIAGAAEAWMVADHIAAAGVAVILDGAGNLPSSFEQVNARLDSPDLLATAGVRFALEAGSLGPGGHTHNARNITQAAGIAVAYGLAWEAALEAITLVPAEIYGVNGQSGSIETGKDADLVLWDADPLELTSYPRQVFIQGQRVSMQNRQTLLRDRYLNTDMERPPAFRK